MGGIWHCQGFVAPNVAKTGAVQRQGCRRSDLLQRWGREKPPRAREARRGDLGVRQQHHELALARGARRLHGTAVYEIGNRFSLGKIQFVVEKGALREFPGACLPCAQAQHALQQQVEDHGTTVGVQFQHVFAGEGMGGGKIDRQACVDGIAVGRSSEE